jgi:sporulation protein YlmC with PRC-barrel domain
MPSVEDMNAEDWKGKAVVAISEGRILGYVQDVLLSGHPLRAVGVVIGGRGPDRLLMLERLHGNGPDAMTVAEASATQELGGTWHLPDDLLPLRELKKRLVVGEDGRLVGKVRMVDLEEGNPLVRRLFVRRGGFLGIGGLTRAIDGDAVRGIGPRLVTVATPA